VVVVASLDRLVAETALPVGPLPMENPSRPQVLVVVPGIGRRDEGWTKAHWSSEEWEGKPITVEVNFNRGAGYLTSFANFSPRASAWADSLKGALIAVARDHPRAGIHIISHSWGTVVAKLVLSGGSTWNGDYLPISDLELRDAQAMSLLTMGSPLCHPRALRLLHVAPMPGKPPMLKGRWVNLYNDGDRIALLGLPVGNLPIADEGCTNIPLDPGTGHTGYWGNPQVADLIQSLMHTP
jgi:hypothetical protein